MSVSTTPPAGSAASRVMAVLDVLTDADGADYPDGLSVMDIARLIHRDKSVASRQLAALLEAGLVTRNETGRYELSWRLFAMAVRAGDRRLTKVAEPVLLHLAHTVQERAYLSVLDGGDVLTVLTESSRRMLEASSWLGRPVPLHKSSAGMALTSDLDDEQLIRLATQRHDLDAAHVANLLRSVAAARRAGHAVALRTFDPELSGIAAPVRDFSGRIVAAVNISGPAARVEDRLPQLARHVMAAAHSLERALGVAPSHTPSTRGGHR